MKPNSHTSLSSHTFGIASFAPMLFTGLLGSLPYYASAADTDGTWLGTGGNWSDITKWNGGTVADGTDFTANFTGVNITAEQTITLTDIGRTIGNIVFTDATTSSNNLTISGANTLTLSRSTGTPVIDVTQTSRRLIISSPIAGTNGLQKEGLGILNLSSANYTGATNATAGLLDFGAIANANIGGGVAAGRNITVSAGASIRFNALSNAFLNRIVETSDEIGVMTATTSNSFNFSSSTGANLPNAFLGNWASNGAKAEIGTVVAGTGVITPGSNGYKLGAFGSSGNLGIVGTNKITGANTLTVGQTGATGIRVTLAGANDFTGNTVINSGAKLTLGNNLALQNSVLNVGSAGGNIAFNGGTAAATITGNLVADSPTFGGLIGSRNLTSVFTSTGGNNESNLANTAVLGFTLNPSTGVDVTYSGAIGGFGTGASGGLNGNSTLTKTGLGKQTLTGVSSYTGATVVNGGTLAIGGAGSINSSTSVSVSAGASLLYNSSTALTKAPVLAGDTVSNRAILGGTGTINVAVILDNLGDTLAPGNSPGTMTFQQSQTSWSSFSYDWEINNFNGVADTNYDQLGIIGSLNLDNTINGAYQLNILSLTSGNLTGAASNFTETLKSFTIATSTTGITDFNASKWTLNNSDFTAQNGSTGSWSLNTGNGGNDLILTYTPIPEPSTAVLGALSLLALLRRKR